MISIIGIPLALIALVFPTLCLWVVIAYLLYKVLPLPRYFAVLGSFVAAIGIMVLVPQLYNFQVLRSVNKLTSGDMQAAISPLNRSETLAVISGSGPSLKCFNRCIDLLLSGQVRAYVAVGLSRGQSEPTGQTRAVRHRLVRAQNCDNPNVLPKNRSTNQNKSGTVAYALNVAAKRGICIQSTEMTLQDVGKMRAVVYRDRRALTYPESLFFIDTQIRPAQVSVYETTAQGEWSKIAQQTSISYSLLGPILAHTISGSTLSSTKSGWWRNRVSVQHLSLEAYMTNAMGAKFRRQ